MVNVLKLTELKFEGIDLKDYPDFCDAFLVEAFYIDKNLTEDEINWVNDNRYEWVNENVYNYIIENQ